MHLKVWTDYPFLALGDKSGEKAPVRQVEVLSYDEDKYCTVRVPCLSQLQDVKLGYLYKKEGRYDDMVRPVHFFTHAEMISLLFLCGQIEE